MKRSPGLVAEAKRLRAEGLSYRAISEQIGVSPMCVFCWLNPCSARRYNARNRAWSAKNPGAFRKWAVNNREKVRERSRQWARGNPEKNREKMRRYRSTPTGNLADNTRRRIRQGLLSLGGKKHRSAKYLGCSYPEYKAYLESLFEPGMSWENFGDWHIDHIVPVSTMRTLGLTPELVFNYKNTRPLWAAENTSKNAKFPDWM